MRDLYCNFANFMVQFFLCVAQIKKDFVGNIRIGTLNEPDIDKILLMDYRTATGRALLMITATRHVMRKIVVHQTTVTGL
jgi:hypothetical protein